MLLQRWLKIFSKNEVFMSGGTVLLAIFIGATILNPLWEKIAIPGLFPKYILPPITAPIDGIYYLFNAERGYNWGNLDPLSLWFHPLLSFLLRIVPSSLPLNYLFWFMSILFAIASLLLILRLSNYFSGDHNISPMLLPICLAVPGGLVIATGNAEIPCLFFNTALLLSVLVWRKWWLTILFAACAILTKPNGLYMVPVLLIYLVNGINTRDKSTYLQAIIGIFAILFCWLAWIWIVDWKTQIPGAYWQVRLAQKYYLGAGDYKIFYRNLFSSFLYDHDIRNQIRYSSALIIPLVNFIIIGLIPLTNEVHRYAMAAGNLAMLGMALFLGNPNKIIVYSTTLPGYFISHMLLFSMINNSMWQKKTDRVILYIVYSVYLLAGLAIFIFGTPLRWYH
jgi:hypothetical protein